jgi:hypothetical protein
MKKNVMHYEFLRRSFDNKKKARFVEALCVSFFAAMHILNFKQNHEEHQDKGADFARIIIEKIKHTIEVKNWKTWYLDKKLHIWRPAYINYNTFVDSILARFLESDPEHLTQWTLFISFFNTNDLRIIQLIEDYNIQVVVFGVQVLDDTTSMSALSNIRKALYINYSQSSVKTNDDVAYEEWREHDFGVVVDYSDEIKREFDGESVSLSSLLSG